jgi:putative acyl-CoA dehydrogenase
VVNVASNSTLSQAYGAWPLEGAGSQGLKLGSMDTLTSTAAADPHALTNQPPPLAGYDSYAADNALRSAVRAGDAGWAEPALHEIGRHAGSEAALALGFEANAHAPVLRTFDRFGARIDEVTFHPAYHELMTQAIGYGLHSSAWSDPRPGAHVARAAGFLLWSQVDAGHGCPISMTHAALPALRVQPELAELWEPLIFARTYEPSLRPATQKRSAIFGMAMTEKQGGSDVRANTTRATPLGRSGASQEYALTGHKWFCSAPMSDAFLVLAQAPRGLSCFVVPRFRPDGSKNVFALQRLKDKLGNRSNASSEVEFADTSGWLIGDEGRGVHAIVEMVNVTRLDCILGAAAGMRQAVAQATHHAAHRSAFGKRLVEHAAMQNVLADLALESEAATVLGMRLAAACDRAAAGDAHEARLKRIGTALGKFWVCKRTAGHAAEALECLGGNGYVEESIMPRLYREAPLNSIWEGSGNVNALDVLRAIAKERGVLDSFIAEVRAVRGAHAALDRAANALERHLADLDDAERSARRIVEEMAVLLQAALLVRTSPDYVYEAFIASRVAGDWGRVYGTLGRDANLRDIVSRATPSFLN